MRTLLLAAALATLVAPLRADEPAAARARKGSTGDLAARLKTLLGRSDRPFALLVTVKVKPGTEQQFERAARKAVAATQAEKGCLGYECHRNLEDHQEYTFIERWKDLAALQAHLREPYTKAILATMREVGARPARVRLLAPVGGVVPDDGIRTRSRPPATEKAPDR
jgi:quinol monooxygenase YgiN